MLLRSSPVNPPCLVSLSVLCGSSTARASALDIEFGEISASGEMVWARSIPMAERDAFTMH